MKISKLTIMKKTLIIALGCLAILFAACKKPTPPAEPVDYTANYVGNHLGRFTLTITSMNNQPQSSMSFPIDSITMSIDKAETLNAIIATVTIDSEPYQATGTVTESQIHFNPIPLNLDRPDFAIEGNINLEGTKNDGKLNITGDFSGHGVASIMGAWNTFDEISGTIAGELQKQ